MNSITRLVVATAVIVIAACSAISLAQSEPVFFTPTPYLSAADIPTGFYAGGAPDCLEDFEDWPNGCAGWLFGLGGVRPPGNNTDSVDADDGDIDGWGTAGHSWAGTVGSDGIQFTFPQPLPTAAGMVWTDGEGTVTFEAFGPGMVSLGTVGPVDIADAIGQGSTAEDHFFGVHDPDGILAIKLSNTSGSIEVDHFQFGSAGTVVSVSEQLSGTLLSQNVPNPFNPKTTIRYYLPRSAIVDLRIFDSAGRLVKILAKGEKQPAGSYSATWTGLDSYGRAMPAGIYFYRLEAGIFTETKRMTLIR